MKEALSGFYCNRDTDVESFLKQKAILYDRIGKGRTYLIIAQDDFENGEIKILAYFTLALKSVKISDEVSKSMKRKLDGLYKNTEDFTSFLIGQLGKNDRYAGFVSGDTIIDYALNVIERAFEIVGGRFILIECSDNGKLIQFYINNGFQILQYEDLVQMIRFII